MKKKKLLIPIILSLGLTSCSFAGGFNFPGFNKEDKDDLDTMMMFLNLLWYYWAKERYQATHKKIFSEIIKIKKAHIIQDIRSIKKQLIYRI